VCSDRSRKAEYAATDQEKKSVQRHIKKRRVCSDRSNKKGDQEKQSVQRQFKKRRVIEKSRVCSDRLRKEE